jgi:hypothetical protein
MLNRAEITNLDFAALPGGLITKPTLVWKLESKKSGKLPLTLTYMTGGISWHAEYVATLADDEKSLDLNGWVSLDNRSGATYEDARGLGIVEVACAEVVTHFKSDEPSEPDREGAGV